MLRLHSKSHLRMPEHLHLTVKKMRARTSNTGPLMEIVVIQLQF